MLADFTAPPTVICFLCKAWISVKKGDKTRFLHHISSDHEVHFDLELVFVLSTMAEGEREAIVNNNQQTEGKVSEKEEEARKLKRLRVEIERTKMDKNVPHIETMVEDPQCSSRSKLVNCSKNKMLEKEEESENIDTIQNQLVLKRLNVEIERTKMDEDVPHIEIVEEDPQCSSRSKLVKCSKCNKRMKRTHLRSHIAANHKKGRKSRQKISADAEQVRRDLVDGVTEDPVDLMDCLFCDQKMAVVEQRAHMRNVHKTDIDPRTLKQEEVSLENSKDIKIPRNSPPAKLEPTEPTGKVKCNICHKNVEASKLKLHLSWLHPDHC